jgi:hypothetical protein
VVDDVRGLGLHDHVCWAYDEQAELRDRSLEFLADGLALGERVCYVASGPAQALLDDVRSLADADGLLRPGALRVAPLEDTYGRHSVVDPGEQVAAYAAATEEALADGFTGFRIVAEATALVRTGEQRCVFARYEHLVDRYMSAHPFSALCAYDRQVLGADAIEEIACLHPTVRAGTGHFRLHASDRAAAALAGEIDVTAHELLPAALERCGPQPSGARLVFDASGLRFIDHRALFALRDYAARFGAVAVLHTHGPVPRRLVDILGIEGVEVEDQVEDAA